MNERYWFVSDENNPFNNKNLKIIYSELNPELSPNQIVIENFIEFKSKQDYIDFFKKH